MNSSKNIIGHVCTILFVVLALIYTLIAGSWPEMYGFTISPEVSNLKKLFDSPVHLSDDVMISLRAGYIFNEIGLPAFNRSDIAQPSTSYVSPYLFAFILKFFHENIAVAIYSFLGLVSVILTFLTIFSVSKSKFNAVVIITALSLTATNTGYALNGWDHLFQALFLSIATAIALKCEARVIPYLLMSISLALGSLFRPDGILIAVSIIVSGYIVSKNLYKTLSYVAAPYLIMLSSALILNYQQFGHFTPTTARLKVGALPSASYAFNYILSNGLLTFSAITIVFFGLIIFSQFYPQKNSRATLPIVLGCFVTVMVAIVNSDVFPSGRMFWTSACVISVVIAAGLPSIINFSTNCFIKSFSLPVEFSSIKDRTKLRILVFAIASTLLASSLKFVFLELKSNVSRSLINEDEIYTSPTAQQFRIAQWIDKNLKPEDGSIGFYWLGVSYHLPNFEIADFLGKADELIATSEIKWGPPGHNKWDTNRTLSKWNVQAIVPAGNSDNTKEVNLNKATKSLTMHSDFGFAPDLILNRKVKNEFSYCYIIADGIEMPDKWGFFLRNDLAPMHASTLSCK